MRHRNRFSFDGHRMHHLALALIVASLAGRSGVAAAQTTPIQRGSVQIGGTASFHRSHDIGNDQGATTLELLPRVGYFIVRGLAVTANIRHRRVWVDDQTRVRDQTFSEWGIGPGLTYFVSTSSPRVFPFVSARTLFIRGESRAEISGSPQAPPLPGGDRIFRTRSYAWLGSAGAMYMLGDHVGITGEAFYQRGRVTIEVDETGESGNSSELYGLQFGVAAFVF